MTTKKEYIEENFPEKEFIEIGFFKRGMSIEEKDKRICKYFGIKNVFMYDHIMDDKTKTVKADLDTFSIN